LEPTADGQGIEQLAEILRFAATSHIALLACLIHKHAWSQSRAFWPPCCLKDCSDFDFPVHIAAAFEFLVLHRHTASPQPCEHPIQFDIQAIDALLFGCRGSKDGDSRLARLLPQPTDLLILPLLQGFS
jgi:hypothetical protein